MTRDSHRYNAKATFFNVANQTESPITTRVIAEGHTLGAHTHHHTALAQEHDDARADTLDAEVRIAEVRWANQLTPISLWILCYFSFPLLATPHLLRIPTITRYRIQSLLLQWPLRPSAASHFVETAPVIKNEPWQYDLLAPCVFRRSFAQYDCLCLAPPVSCIPCRWSADGSGTCGRRLDGSTGVLTQRWTVSGTRWFCGRRGHGQRPATL
jgi:hypothetical protein